MPDPFVKIPFKIGNSFEFGPPSCTASVVVQCEGKAIPGVLLLRAGRAAGLACDNSGRRLVACVRIQAGKQPLQCRSTEKTAAFSVSRDAVVRANPSSLQKLFEKVLEISKEKDGSGIDFEFSGDAKRPRAERIKALVFENLFVDPDFSGEMGDYFACGSFQLASSLRSEGHDVITLKGSLDGRTVFSRIGQLDTILEKEKPDLVCVTLLEACIGETARLVEYVGSKSDALIAVGGPAATIAPEHAAAHLESANFIIRGDGEEALCRVAGLCRHLRSLESPGGGVIRELLSHEGTIFKRGGTLIMGHPGRVNVLRYLDTSPFNVTLLQKRHVKGGLSLETSRGCIHPCTFCSAPSRGHFRGRSARGITLRLRAYRERLDELWEGDPPDSTLRIQFPDDDFTCDSGRSARVLDAVGESGFYLSSFQASVRDFFERERGEWKIDPRLPPALSPKLFQDASLFGRLLAGPPAGKRERRFNSFVKLGVESFCNEELRRLGKGYKLEQVRKVIHILDELGMVHDAYFIFSNRRTRINDIVTSLIDISRLKIEHPYTFYIRFPIVPYLVTTYVSPSFRIWLNEKRKWADNEGEKRRTGDLEIEKWMKVRGFPEYDYPIVKRDVPADPFVAGAAEKIGDIFEPDGMYIRPMKNLRRMLIGMLPSIEEKEDTLSAEASDGRIAIRRLAGAEKLIVYNGIRRAREMKLSKPVAERYNRAAAMFGEAAGTAVEIRKYIEVGDPRLVLIPTRDCSLRCRYCPMIKEEGKLMDEETAIKAIEMLLSSPRPSVILQFFGGEALLRRRFVIDAMLAAGEMAERIGKKLGFIVSTNGVSLDESLIELFMKMPVKIEVSIDGTRDVHLKHRIGKVPGTNSYDSIVKITPALLGSGIPGDAIMVVNPDTVDGLCESFAHVVELGYRRVQVNNALGVIWTDEQKKQFAEQLYMIEKRFFKKSVRPGGLELVDLWSFRRPMLLNCEITVDYDGAIYFGNGFLVRTSTRGAFNAGHIDDMECFDSYYIRRPDNDYLLGHTYPKDVTENNLQVGRILGSFIQHVRGEFPEEFSRMHPTRVPEAPVHRW